MRRSHLGLIYEDLRESVNALARRTAAAGLPVQVGSHVDQTTRGVPVVDLLLRAAANPKLITPCILSLTCGTLERKLFFIYLECAYHDEEREGVLPFEFYLRLRHDMGEFPPADVLYEHRTDGRVVRRAAKAEDFVGPEDIHQTVERWLADAEFWSRT